MTLSITIQESSTGLNLQGTVHVNVTANPAPVRVEYYLDNTLMVKDLAAPYSWAWDTTKEGNGTHVIRAEAVYKSRRSRAQITVSTKNGTSPTYSSASFGTGTFGGQGFAARFRSKIAEFLGFTPKE